ncbi:MAG: PBP1A family penicillin-binding protein [Lachnospiraceae bacterium]|nr:PBP1A family penicillin-binding protein [Lachnospiraceae bacterium]
MNYGKRSIRRKQRQLNSKSTKFSKMFLLYFFKALLVCIIAVGIIGICFGIGIFKGILASAPDISSLDVRPTGYATVVYDSTGKQIAKLVGTDSNRSYVNMDLIPQDMADAFVAIEDERFYQHNGIDIKGIVRAAYVAVQSRDLTQGASTITQQLLKNNVFEGWVGENSNFVKIKRKIQEQYLAIELEKRMDKKSILELYMNSINLGQNTLGVQAASMRYFNKPVSQLTLSECAVIAGITQNPSKFNPISHPDKNAERRAKVLRHMLEQGYITQAEHDKALADNVYERIQMVNEEKDTESINTYYVDALIDEVTAVLMEEKGYNETQAYKLVYSGGLQIYAAQDPKIQRICDDIYNNEENYPENTKWLLDYQLTVKTKNGDYVNHSTEMFKAYFQQQSAAYNLLYDSQDAAYEDIAAYQAAVLGTGDKVHDESINLTPQPQVSITVQDQSTGHVVAMVGGRGTKIASRTLNRATDTMRQPGSTFKVLAAFAPALDSAGMTLASVQNDAPYTYEDGTPVNNWYGEAYKGICSLRYGIEQSLNIVTVKTLTQITPQLGFDYLQEFGFTTLVEKRTVDTADGPKIFTDITQSLALGGVTDGVTNMELNAAYAAIANGGAYIKPTLFTKILDHDGNVLIDNTVPTTRQVIKESTAYLLTDAMVDVVTKGTGGAVNFGGNIAIAGKTGTTSDNKDVWFAGYSPYYTATTWTGYDNNVKMRSSAETSLSKAMWRKVMSQIHENLPAASFTKPSGIVTATICSKSGKLPIAGICDAYLATEYFAEGTVPTDSCTVHVNGIVCMATGMSACTTCPYQRPGVIEIPPGDDGLPGLTNYCPHTPTYFLDPNNIAAIQAAQAAMQQQAQAQQQQQAQAQQQTIDAQADAQENGTTEEIPTE